MITTASTSSNEISRTRSLSDQIEDVQGRSDHRKLAIDKVGICDIRHPVSIQQRGGGYQSTIATFGMYVGLPHDLKGTHMSRFVEILNAHEQPITLDSFKQMIETVIQRLEAQSGYVSMTFPYFLSKKAPVTGASSVMDYEVTLFGNHHAGQYELEAEVKVPVTTLCPCSKDISDYGAHNQRSLISVRIQSNRFFWIEELIEMVEAEGSCELYGILKRIDEKSVTERAYENPKFVEDVVRDIASRLNTDERFRRYRITSENFESIHNHSAYAEIACDKDQTSD